MSTFKELGVSAKFVDALADSNIINPTEIQGTAIPKLLQDPVDFIGLAQTGTGKTAAFSLPILEQVNSKDAITQSLVVAPTRELVQQIASDLNSFAKNRRDIKIQAVFGGASIATQIRDIKRNVPHILVATPGRLIDLLKRKIVRVNEVKTVVLDEADEMLNMGFKEDIYKILSYTPEEKKTWLFSASMPKEIKKIVKEFMTNPYEITVKAEDKVNKNIEHQYCIVRRHDKTKALRRFFDSIPELYGLVFCRTKIDTQRLADELSAQGYPAEPIHGDLSQQQRDRVMKKFRDSRIKVLIATDVAARGIDVDDLTHVFHHTIPDDKEFYTHRSGRTARAGKKGISLSLVTQAEERKIHRYARELNIKVAKVEVPSGGNIRETRILQWTESLMQTKNILKPEELEHVTNAFQDVSKEELIKLVLSAEIQKWSLPTNEDLNVHPHNPKSHEQKVYRERKPRNGSREKGKEVRERKKPRSSKSSNEKMHRFFINAGSMDRINKKDLAEYVCEQGGISRKDLGEITLGRAHSFFEVSAMKSKPIANRFKGKKLNGRPLRVNRDHK